MFENISKGEVHLPHFCNTEPNSCNCGFLFIGEDATTMGWIYHNKHEGDVGEEDYPEKDGKYYVVGVSTSINEGGGKRTVKIGVKVSV